MTDDVFSKFSVCLQAYPTSKATPWATVARFYFIMLMEIPDEDAEVLMIAVGKTFEDFRPMPPRIIELWRKIKSPPRMTAVEAVSEIYRAVKEGNLVACTYKATAVLRTPDCSPIEDVKAYVRQALNVLMQADKRGEEIAFPEKPHDLKLGEVVEIDRQVMMKASGPPKWLLDDPLLAMIVDVMGGWEALATNEGGMDDFQHSRLHKVAQQVIAGADTEVIDGLRAEYQRHRLSAPSETIKELE